MKLAYQQQLDLYSWLLIQDFPGSYDLPFAYMGLLAAVGSRSGDKQNSQKKFVHKLKSVS